MLFSLSSTVCDSLHSPQCHCQFCIHSHSTEVYHDGIQLIQHDCVLISGELLGHLSANYLIVSVLLGLMEKKISHFFFCLNCLKKHWSVVVNFSFVERTGISEKKIHWKRSMIFPSALWEWFVVFSFYSSRLTLFFEPVCVCVCVCVFCCCFPTGPLASAARFDRVGYGLILKRNPGMKHHLHFCAHLHCPLL